MSRLFHLTIGAFAEQPRLEDILRGALRSYDFVEIIIIILRRSEPRRAVAAGAEDTCAAIRAGSAPANAYFDAIGGAGSSVDLRLQGKAPLERAREQERQAKCMQTEERRAAAKEKANGFRSLSTADLRAKLDAAGLDSSGSKTALVKRLLSAPSAAASGGAAGGPEVAPSPGAPAAPPPEEGAPPAPAAAAGPLRTPRARAPPPALSYAAFSHRSPLLKRRRETPRSSAGAGQLLATPPTKPARI